MDGGAWWAAIYGVAQSRTRLSAFTFTFHFHFHRVSLVAQRLKCLPAMQETGFDPWVRKIPWRREWQPTIVFLPGEFHEQTPRVIYLGVEFLGCIITI